MEKIYKLTKNITETLDKVSNQIRTDLYVKIDSTIKDAVEEKYNEQLKAGIDSSKYIVIEKQLLEDIIDDVDNLYSGLEDVKM